MSKPIEYLVDIRDEGIFIYEGSTEIEIGTIRMIEKPAADMLAEALEMILDEKTGHMLALSLARRALKKYRGES